MLLLTTACETETHTAPPKKIQEAIATNTQPEETTELFIHWGTAKIPLRKYANPEVYEGSVEISITEFWDLLAMPIDMKRKGKSLPFELADIYREPLSWSDSLRNNYPSLEGGQLGPDIIQKYREGVRQGDVISLRLFSTSDETIVQSAYLIITDPQKPYYPEKQVYQPRMQEDVFGFQVIQEPGKRPVLRIDTTAESTRQVYDLYKNNLLYKVIHIPGFQTQRRLLTDAHQLFNSREIRKSSVLDKAIIDWLQLPEYISYGYPSLKLGWGEMKATPSGMNQKLDFFRKQFVNQLELDIGGQKINIRGFKMIISSEQHHPRAVVADDIQHPVVQKMLSQVQPASSVYFTQLIIDGEEGQCMLLPQNFAFHIGRK
jgi:hypothetical protein